MIFTLEGKGQAIVKKAVAGMAKTQYQPWMEGAARRKKDREQMLAAVASVDPHECDVRQPTARA